MLSQDSRRSAWPLFRNSKKRSAESATFVSSLISLPASSCKEPCPDARPKRWSRRPVRESSSSFPAVNVLTSLSTRAGFVASSKNLPPPAGTGQSARDDHSVPNPEAVKSSPRRGEWSGVSGQFSVGIMRRSLPDGRSLTAERCLVETRRRVWRCCHGWSEDFRHVTI